MPKILRLKDRVKLKTGDVVFTIAPLNQLQKTEIVACTETKGGSDMINLTKASALYIKYSVKDMKGVKDFNDKEYELEFDDSGDLTDDCVSELMTLDEKNVLIQSSGAFIHGIGDIEKLEGVEVEVLPGK